MKDGWRIFGWPLAIAVSTLIGLLAALWGGAGWHWLSWVGLTTPIVVVLVKLMRARFSRGFK